MGTWGTGIFQDDTACEVRDEFKELIAEGQTPAEATAAVLANYAHAIDDPEAGTVVWLALAATQWKLGRLQPEVARRALEVIETGSDLSNWDDSSHARRRSTVLRKLGENLKSPQPPARPVRRAVVQSTDWLVGDAYEYQLLSGGSAVLRVLRLWPSNPQETIFEPCCDLVDADVTPDLISSGRIAAAPARRPLLNPRSRADWFLLSQLKGKYPADRVRLVARGLVLPTSRGSMGAYFWKTFDADLERDFGLV